MAIKNIVQIGNKVLRTKAKPVRATETVKIRKLIKDLVDTLHNSSLVGIAAPQIGVGLQIFISEVRKTKFRNPRLVDRLRVYINPRIITYSKKETILDEGCGSVCSTLLHGPVLRPESLEVEALDENLKPFSLKASGLLAKIIQHEYDHLQGIVILDKFADTSKCYVKS